MSTNPFYQQIQAAYRAQLRPSEQEIEQALRRIYGHQFHLTSAGPRMIAGAESVRNIIRTINRIRLETGFLESYVAVPPPSPPAIRCAHEGCQELALDRGSFCYMHDAE
ncbi:hypothetical protein [Hymenobacter jeollabukensis]|uniref:Uncharacterized protein n=1 Tax=Hymenobacter jeollabukensis TaxID=2025313 RepID=A0A5R8WLY2_9BACT|nr:hypothetical protein [Hymenobacter jeollabukensis]TLM90425.1 hypothetical protein FDY95_17035 [Hymenobacter jeollabukensis]